jgi:superfamily I DNA and/or RNA helicase
MLSNRHFYNNMLINGVSAQQRSPIVPGLPPLVFCDCMGGRSQAAEGGGRSSVNRAEAQLVVQLVLALLNCRVQQQTLRDRLQHSAKSAGCEEEEEEEEEEVAQADCSQSQEEEEEFDVPAVPAVQLGVICFFRGQANLIRQMLAAGELQCTGGQTVGLDCGLSSAEHP